MTTIRSLTETTAHSLESRVSGLALKVILVATTAGLLGVGGMMATLSVSMGSDVSDALSRELSAGIERLRPGFSCDVSGAIVAAGEANCLDHRGFRVRKDHGYRIYSMRYSKPLFVFGLEGGLIFVNQKIDRRLQAAEQSAFAAYFRD